MAKEQGVAVKLGGCTQMEFEKDKWGERTRVTQWEFSRVRE